MSLGKVSQASELAKMPGVRILQGRQYTLKMPHAAWKVAKYGVFSVPYFPAFGHFSCSVSMREYALIILNILECARILNVSDAVNNIRSLYKLLSSYQIQNIAKHLRWSVLQKE